MILTSARHYWTHADTLAMVERGEYVHRAALYTAMYEADKRGDLGNTYRVDPNAGTVDQISYGAEIVDDGQIVLDYAESYDPADVMAKVTAYGTDYVHIFDRAEVLLPVHYRRHMSDYVEGGTPFRFQCIAIECMRSQDDELYEVEPIDSEPYGWALVVKVDAA